MKLPHRPPQLNGWLPCSADLATMPGVLLFRWTCYFFPCTVSDHFKYILHLPTGVGWVEWACWMAEWTVISHSTSLTQHGVLSIYTVLPQSPPHWLYAASGLCQIPAKTKVVEITLGSVLIPNTHKFWLCVWSAPSDPGHSAGPMLQLSGTC